jgi:hypothetical protein
LEAVGDHPTISTPSHFPVEAPTSMHLFGIPLKTPALREAIFVALFTLVVCCVVVLTMRPQEGGAVIAGTVGILVSHTHGVSPRKQGIRGVAAMLVIYAVAGSIILGVLQAVS